MPGVTVQLLKGTSISSSIFSSSFALIRKGQINKKKFQREKFYNSIWFKAKFKANNRSQTTYSSLAPGKTVTALFITRREKNVT